MIERIKLYGHFKVLHEYKLKNLIFKKLLMKYSRLLEIRE